MDIFRSIENGNTQEVISWIEDPNTEKNVFNLYGDIPLIHAIRWGKKNIVKIFIEKDVHVNYINPSGFSILSFAVGHSYDEIVLLLIKKGADVNARDKWGSTPLHAVAYCKDENIARVLIEKGAEINATNNEGYTAIRNTLFYDSKYNITKFLLSEGACLLNHEGTRENNSYLKIAKKATPLLLHYLKLQCFILTNSQIRIFLGFVAITKFSNTFKNSYVQNYAHCA